MKKITLCILIFCVTKTVTSQVYWTETFGSGIKNTSIDLLDTGNGAWTEVLNGAQGVKANSFFASVEECGNAANTCGSVCPSDASLHVGSVNVGLCAGGDCGAAYFASGTSLTNKDAISPLIDNTGLYGITISYNFIGYGEGTQDVASWSYSCDGGGSWTFVTNLTTNCCNGGGSPISCTAFSCLLGCQGRWTAYTYTLPACADNIPDFQIKFNWKNDTDNNGNDPSFAVDDVTLSYLTLPIELISFNATEMLDEIKIDWTTQSEINNDYFSVERSFDGKEFYALENISGAGNSTTQLTYSYNDHNLLAGARYYRLKQTDYDGNFKYSDIIPLIVKQQTIVYNAQQYPDQLILLSHQYSFEDLHFVLFNAAGSMITSLGSNETSNSYTIDLQSIPKGMYIIAAKNDRGEFLFRHQFSNY